MILFGWFSTTVALILIYADVTKTIERERMWCLDFKTIQEVGFCTLHCSFWPKVRDMITPRKQLCTLITEKKCNRHCQRFCQEVPRAQGWNLESWQLSLLKKNIEGIIIYALWFGINVTFLLSEKSKREIRVFVKRPRGVTSHQLCIIPELQNLQENLGFLQTELCIVTDVWPLVYQKWMELRCFEVERGRTHHGKQKKGGQKTNKETSIPLIESRSNNSIQNIRAAGSFYNEKLTQ